MSDEAFSWYVVCDSDLCDPYGFATEENAREHKKEHEWVNPHTARVRPASEVNV